MTSHAPVIDGRNKTQVIPPELSMIGRILLGTLALVM